MSHHRSLGSYARAYVAWRIVHELMRHAEDALKRRPRARTPEGLQRAPELAPGMRVRLFIQLGDQPRGTLLKKDHAPGYWLVRWDDEADTRTVHVSRLWPADKGE